MPKLFEPFFRGEARASRQGLGLGLYIASQIALAHGGTLIVASTLAQTRFTFTMPLECSRAAPFSESIPAIVGLLTLDGRKGRRRRARHQPETQGPIQHRIRGECRHRERPPRWVRHHGNHQCGASQQGSPYHRRLGVQAAYDLSC